MRQMKGQQGFTLIELIVVIVILGILAVTAAPKFISFTSDAHKSAMDGLKGGIKGTMTVVYADAAIKGVTASATSTSATYPTAYGYPQATNASLLSALAVTASAGIASLTATQLASDWLYIANSGTITIAPAGKSAVGDDVSDATKLKANNCFLDYVESSADGALPTISVTTSGC